MIVPVLVDSALVYLAFYSGYALRFYVNLFKIPFPEKLAWASYNRAMPLVIGIFVFFLAVFSLYDRRRDPGPGDVFLSVFKAWAWSVLVILALSFFYRGVSFSRIAFFYSSASVLILLLAEKSLSFTVFRLKKNVLVAGDTEEALYLEDSLMRKSWVRCVRTPNFSPGGFVPDEIIICDPDLKPEALKKITEYARLTGASLKFPVAALPLPLLPKKLEMEAGVALLDFSGGLYDRHNRIIKRAFDIVAASAALLFLLPVFAAAAVIILLDSGAPVLYFQKRIGYLAKPFRIIKFRTMIRGAEILQDFVRKDNAADGRIFKVKNDPRLTRAGAQLRKFYIDELPQLLNVLKGEMSLIGPRPLPESDIRDLSDLPERRYDALPGITGLWQIHADKKLSFQAMLKLDLYYIDNWSLLLDIRIFLDTLPIVLFGIGGC